MDHRDRKLGAGHAREPHTEVLVYLCMFVCEGACVLVCVCACVCACVSVRMEGRGQEGEINGGKGRDGWREGEGIQLYYAFSNSYTPKQLVLKTSVVYVHVNVCVCVCVCACVCVCVHVCVYVCCMCVCVCVCCVCAGV